MVINDVLNTRKKDIERIRENFSLAVSFEDLGPGARRTDLTINELYDTARFHGRNVLWGRKYFFLREEFALARPHRFTRSASSIMLAFGGTDQHDLARKIVVAILPICRELGLAVYIVTGPGYRGYDRLMRLVQDESRISLTHDSQVISGLMEQVQVAITSNGRTVYEFAHMNIPAIVIAQHERELTHSFASLENGFIPLGLYDPGKTEKRVQQALRNLITNGSLRKTLHQRMSQHRFSENKERVLRQLNKLLMRKSRKRSVVQA
jgi:spore coat polysaccharide biosynthesis predicted glycosyltransferase SpsG